MARGQRREVRHRGDAATDTIQMEAAPSALDWMASWQRTVLANGGLSDPATSAAERKSSRMCRYQQKRTGVAARRLIYVRSPLGPVEESGARASSGNRFQPVRKAILVFALTALSCPVSSFAASATIASR